MNAFNSDDESLHLDATSLLSLSVQSASPPSERPDARPTQHSIDPKAEWEPHVQHQEWSRFLAGAKAVHGQSVGSTTVAAQHMLACQSLLDMAVLPAQPGSPVAEQLPPAAAKDAVLKMSIETTSLLEERERAIASAMDYLGKSNAASRKVVVAWRP